MKNRSADDITSANSERDEAENAFFMDAPWSRARDRCGVVVLKARLSHLLKGISNQEFPFVKAEVTQKLASAKEQLDLMGPARGDESAQRLYLGKLANQFQAIAHDAEKGYYAGEKLFQDHPGMRLVTRISTLCEEMSTTFAQCAHLDVLDDGCGGDDANEEETPMLAAKGLSNSVPTDYNELETVLEDEDFECLPPIPGNTAARIRDIYLSNRGLELGTLSLDGFLSCNTLLDPIN